MLDMATRAVYQCLLLGIATICIMMTRATDCPNAIVLTTIYPIQIRKRTYGWCSAEGRCANRNCCNEFDGFACVIEPGSMQEVCQMETFEARCPDGHVIVMQNAVYGRMRTGRCVRVNYGNLGCVSDVVRYFDGQCSGRQECSVKIPDDHLYAMSVCPPDVTPYLEATYNCIQVISGRHHHHACQSNGAVVLTGPSQGIIASSTVFASRAGPRLCPWIIQAKPGQRINVTLVDFGLAQGEGSVADVFRATCHKYAMLLERSVSSPTTVCSGKQRERNIYLSKSHRLEIEFVDTRGTDVQSNFFFKYSFLGCSDPPLNGNVLLERTSEKAVLRCNSTGQKWYLYCHGARWNAQATNCTVTTEDWSSPQGIVITVGIGVALGTVIGLALLFCVLLCMKRRQKRDAPGQNVYYESHTLPKDHPSGKWDAGSDGFPDVGYNTCGRRTTKEGHYAHVWNPVNHDVMVMETTDFPRRVSAQSGRPMLERMPSPSSTIAYLEHAEHVYEKPK